MIIWSGGEKVEDAADLDYIPSIVTIYADLSRQIRQAMQPPAVAFTACEQLSIPLTDAEKEEERETTMYIEMFSVVESKQSKVMQTQDKPTQAAQTTQPETTQDSGSERTLSDDEEGEEEAQQKTIQAIVERLKSHLEVQQLPTQAKGKRKADEVEGLNFEELAT